MSQEAARAYGKALRKVGEALQNPASAATDETILSILLFALYEVHYNHKHRVEIASSKTFIEEFKTCVRLRFFLFVTLGKRALTPIIVDNVHQ